jgi:hypothetical protein
LKSFISPSFPGVDSKSAIGIKVSGFISLALVGSSLFLYSEYFNYNSKTFTKILK